MGDDLLSLQSNRPFKFKHLRQGYDPYIKQVYYTNIRRVCDTILI